METKKIAKLIHKNAQVKIYYFNEEIYCQILQESKTLIMVRDIKDWHYDAYMIFPKKYIKKIQYGQIEKCRENILPPLKRKKFIKDINKVNLSSIKKVLKSLKMFNQGICIENAIENNYFFTVGMIKKIKNKKILFKEVDLCGKYNKKHIKVAYDDITCIIYKDEYSTKLLTHSISP